MERLLSRMGSWVWGPGTLALVLGLGGWLTVSSRFFPLRRWRTIWRETWGSLLGRGERPAGGVSPFQAMATALGSTVGVGSIAGVASAITLGGPGAVFWMWVSALAGMMTKYAEVVLAVRYQGRDRQGNRWGGPMAYMAQGLGSRRLAGLFAAAGTAASFGIGNLNQSQEAAAALESLWGWPRPLSGCLLALFTLLVMKGGVRWVGRLAGALVPVMALFYLGGGAVVILQDPGRAAQALGEIGKGAFGWQAAAGGAAGWGIGETVRYGVARGIFSNEAGLGSAAMAHGAAQAQSPARQGMWGIGEVFLSTMVICTVTAVTVIASGLAGTGAEGGRLAAQAFQAFLGPWGGQFVSLSILAFALSTLLGWSYYGQRCVAWLAGEGEGAARWYRRAFVLCAGLGALGRSQTVWALADLLNGLMALPNLAAVALLSPVVWREMKKEGLL